MLIIGSIYLSLLLISTLVSLVIAWAAWSRRSHSGALPLVGVGLSLAILSASSAMEALVPAMPTKVFWLNIQLIGYGFLPVCYLLMVMQYLGMPEKTTWRRTLCLMLIPLITVLLSWSNDSHHLIRDNLRLEYTSGLVFVAKRYGLWLWINNVYSYFLMAASIGLLLHPRLHSHGYFRAQTRAMLWSLLIPYTTSILYILHVSLSRSMDLTPAVAAFSAVIIMLRVLRYRLFEIMPVARSSVVDSMSEGVLVLDVQGRIVDLNPASRRLLGLDSSVIGQHAGEVLAELPGVRDALTGAAVPAQCEIVLPGVPERCVEMRLSTVADRQGQALGRLALFHDITERKEAERTISYLAYHDRLTDLPNRELFHERLLQELARARRTQGRVALLVLDLDNFKEINDTYGHLTGDQLLREVAARMRSLVREADMLCRLGGDEFAVMLVDVNAFTGAQSLADRLRHALAQPAQIDGHLLNATTSIGISLYPEDGVTPEALFRRADEAMYRNKRARKTRRRREQTVEQTAPQ